MYSILRASLKENRMLSRHQRNLQLLNLSSSLHLLADRLQPDRNAARFLVHETLMTAFARPTGETLSADQDRETRRALFMRARNAARS